MKIRVLKIAVHAALLALAMLYGIMVAKFKLPPYHLIQPLYRVLIAETNLEIPKEYFETDVTKLISIRDSQDIARLRDTLISFLWGQPKLPSFLPSAIVKGFKDNRYNDIPSLSRIDKLSIVMEFGLESHVYHFIPKTPNNKIVLFHRGHGGDFYKSKEQISEFLDSGYTVAAFSMPLLGLNNQPTVYPKNRS